MKSNMSLKGLYCQFAAMTLALGLVACQQPSTTTTTPEVKPAPAPQTASEELWKISAAGTPGVLKLSKDGDKITGAIKWGASDNPNNFWESLKDVSYDATSKKLTFARTAEKQIYTGSMSNDGKKYKGVYLQGSETKEYMWVGDKLN